MSVLLSNDYSEKEQKHISQNHNSDAHQFEHHLYQQDLNHGHSKEPTLVVDFHSQNHMQPNYANYDQTNLHYNRFYSQHSLPTQ